MPISRDLGFFSLSGRVKTDKWPLELARPPGQGGIKDISRERRPGAVLLGVRENPRNLVENTEKS